MMKQIKMTDSFVVQSFWQYMFTWYSKSNWYKQQEQSSISNWKKNKIENDFHAKMCQDFSYLISKNLRSSLSLNHVLKEAIILI